MGWGSAGSIFDAVAEPLIHVQMDPNVKTDILVALIKELQNGDWDTEDESLEAYERYPFIVTAFEICDVKLPCSCQCCQHESGY